MAYRCVFLMTTIQTLGNTKRVEIVVTVTAIANVVPVGGMKIKIAMNALQVIFLVFLTRNVFPNVQHLGLSHMQTRKIENVKYYRNYFIYFIIVIMPIRYLHLQVNLVYLVLQICMSSKSLIIQSGMLELTSAWNLLNFNIKYLSEMFIILHLM